MNDQDTINEEMPAVSGCQALGPKVVLPSGFDGVEPREEPIQIGVKPLVRTDYEDVIADLFHKCNEAFIHAPQQREARPMYFKTVVGDIADELASVVPVEKVGESKSKVEVEEMKEVIYRTPDAAMDVVIDNLTPDLLKRICERHGLKKRMTHDEYYTVSEDCKLKQFKATNATRLIAVRKGREGNADFLYEISVDHEKATAVIERDGEMMYKIMTLDLSYRRCIHAAINVLRSHLHENDKVHRLHNKSRQRRAEESLSSKKED